jgi:hypothetical protein
VNTKASDLLRICHKLQLCHITSERLVNAAPRSLAHQSFAHVLCYVSAALDSDDDGPNPLVAPIDDLGSGTDSGPENGPEPEAAHRMGADHAMITSFAAPNLLTSSYRAPTTAPLFASSMCHSCAAPRCALLIVYHAPGATFEVKRRYEPLRHKSAVTFRGSQRAWPALVLVSGLSTATATRCLLPWPRSDARLTTFTVCCRQAFPYCGPVPKAQRSTYRLYWPCPCHPLDSAIQIHHITNIKPCSPLFFFRFKQYLFKNTGYETLPFFVLEYRHTGGHVHDRVCVPLPTQATSWTSLPRRCRAMGMRSSQGDRHRPHTPGTVTGNTATATATAMPGPRIKVKFF